MFWKKKKKIEDRLSGNFLKEVNVPEKEEEKRISAIIASFTDGILVFDENKKLSLINPCAEKLLDIEGKEVLGQSILKLSRFPKAQSLVSLLGGEIKEVSKKELEIDKNFTLEVSVVLMETEGIEIGSLVILHDVSREKIVEKAKSEFVTLSAHQLRTPTSAVKWSIQTLLDGDLGEMTNEQKEMLEKTYKTNERMIKLINDFLNVAKIEEGKYISKTALADVIDDIVLPVIDLYEGEIEKKKLKFTFKKPERELPRVMVDLEKIRIALKNLLDNAVKYTPSGGELAVIVKSERGEIEIQVKDTGLGIPENQQSKIFKKFFRGSSAMKMETEGTGFGLFIVKNIIEAHGGRIWFESEEKKGSTFHFAIPVREKFGEFLTEEFY